MKLDLSWNSLGNYIEDMLNLKDAIKYLPYNMKYFELDLAGNDFGKNENFM